MSEPAAAIAPRASDDADVLDLIDDVEPVSPDELRIGRAAWEKYGEDLDARRADLAAGRHPCQLPR